MKRRVLLLFCALSLGAILAGCNDDDDNNNGNGPTVISANGDINAEVGQFRALLGDPNNGGTAGPLATGRREINWDGVPALQTNVSTFPGNFFAGRGVVFTGGGFQVSDTGFSDIDSTYSTQLEDFSPVKIFSPLVQTTMGINIHVPGQPASAATVRGFGIVFTDVDVVGSAWMTFYDRNGIALLSRNVATRASGSLGHSFLGVVFPEAVVARIEVNTGNAALANGVRDVSNGGTVDVVAMDDYLYREPQAIP